MALETEIWEKYIIRDISRARDNSFLKELKDRSTWLNNKVIHIPVAGGLPEVLENNTTYPLSSVERKDGEVTKSTIKLETKPTIISIDETKYLSYDRVSSVNEDHKEALVLQSIKRSLHNLAPSSDSGKSPLVSIGSNSIKKSIIDLGMKLTKSGVPLQNRVLILSPEHHALMMNLDNNYQGQYNNIKEGTLGVKLYGFTIYTSLENPVYASGNKKSYRSIIVPTDKVASVAFWKGNTWKAMESPKLYATEPRAEDKRRLISYVEYFGAGLVEEGKYCGAIID